MSEWIDRERVLEALRKALVHQPETRDLAKADIFEYIEMFYNRTQCHSHLGGVSPGGVEITSNRGL